MKYLLYSAIACLVLAVALVVFFFVSSAMMPEGSGANIGGGLAMLAAGPLATIGAVCAVIYLVARKR